jgi:DNA polymerase-3 subunit delta'
MEPFASVPEQHEAKRLLAPALAEPAHAYLLHGPRGVGKRAAALALAASLLGDERRVLGQVHPDLRVVEPLGEMIRIDEIRALHRDLHMRPFEAGRRVYLLLGAHLLNEEAADALLKDLEEPPAYATIVLVADELGPLPDTIRSRCQLIPFRRLSEASVRAWLTERAPDLADADVRLLGRVAGGRLDRAAALLDPDARLRRAALVEVARDVYRAPDFDSTAAARRVLDAAAAAGTAAREREEAVIADLDLSSRDAEQRVRRAQRGAERETLLAALEELASWYRDLVVVGAGAEQAAVNVDRLDDLRADAGHELARSAEDAAAIVRGAWRAAEELNVNPSLALDALFVRLRRVFPPVAATTST